MVMKKQKKDWDINKSRIMKKSIIIITIANLFAIVVFAVGPYDTPAGGDFQRTYSPSNRNSYSNKNSSRTQSYNEYSNWENWAQHDIARLYEKVELDSYSIDKDGNEINEVFVPTKIDNGTYKVEVYKISSKFYQVKGTNIYMYFRYAPYMYNYDKGVLDVSYSSAIFYKKP
jgi:hypothetical protein